MLFSQGKTVGTFKGFTERGLEFAADIVARYDDSWLEHPQLGQFLLIELGSTEEAALGRITRLLPSGLLAGPEGEDYMNTMQIRSQPVPEDLKRQRLKYRVQVKLLGAVRMDGENEIRYIPSQRRLPHLGAQVAWPSPEVLRKLCSLSRGSTELGDYVLGEFLFCGANSDYEGTIFRTQEPKLPVTFDVTNLVARRSVVFARAGYGKSNLIKFLIAELYKIDPRTDGGLPVGTIVFDADGEYFWPDIIKNRSGLCDVPHLQQDRIVLFTNRRPPNTYYAAWKLGEVKLDIRQLQARDVIGIAISQERQEQQNILKLKALSSANWTALVDLIGREGLRASDEAVGELLGYSTRQIQTGGAEIAAARSNMSGVIRALHDPESRLLAGTLEALRRGSIVIVDISLLSSSAGNMLAGLLLRRIFSNNQENFTSSDGSPIIPTIAVIEEAQSVLGKRLDESSPFVEWVKEGRKYDLGAILITQQPGSMAPEILSQADNWFCFHLLSEGDASTLGKYNSHYSGDVLAHLIAEPIVGNCYMWSAPHQPFVLPLRVRSFEALYGRDTGASAGPSLETRAHVVRAALSSAEAELKIRLVAELNKQKIRWIPFSGGASRVGLGAGQLWYLIGNLKSETDTRTAEQLKKPLLESLLGTGKVELLFSEDEKKECFVAESEDWERALGKPPQLRPKSKGEPSGSGQSGLF